jgi:hypothetical protein
VPHINPDIKIKIEGVSSNGCAARFVHRLTVDATVTSFAPLLAFARKQGGNRLTHILVPYFVFYKRRQARFNFIAYLDQALQVFTNRYVQFGSGAEFYHPEFFAGGQLLSFAGPAYDPPGNCSADLPNYEFVPSTEFTLSAAEGLCREASCGGTGFRAVGSFGSLDGVYPERSRRALP